MCREMHFVEFFVTSCPLVSEAATTVIPKIDEHLALRSGYLEPFILYQPCFWSHLPARS